MNVFRCPRAPFYISLGHYFSFRSKRSLVAARNTKEKINFRIASSVATCLATADRPVVAAGGSIPKVLGVIQVIEKLPIDAPAPLGFQIPSLFTAIRRAQLGE